MKKVFLMLLFVSSFFSGIAQQYQMTVKVHIRTTLNNLHCDSHYRLTFKLQDGTTWQWYQQLGMSEDQWGDFTNTFSFSHDNPVVNINVATKRYTKNIQGCDYQDGGDQNVLSQNTSFDQYLCNSQSWTGKFKGGYDANSSLTVEITPLSFAKTTTKSTDVYAIQTDTKIVAKDLLIDLEYTVSVKFSNTTLVVMKKTAENFAKDAESNYQQLFLIPATVLPANLEATEIIVESSYWGLPFSKKGGTKTFTFAGTSTLDKTYDYTYNPFSGISDFGPGSYVRVRYGKVQTPVNYTPSESFNALPSSNNITLSVPGVHNSYQWQYQPEGSSDWTNLPSSFGTSKTINISGEALFGSNWQTYLFKNIHFKALYTGCTLASNRETAFITLRHLPSAPGIVYTDFVMETCNASNDAQIKVAFDRPLYQGENLYISINGETNDSNPSQMDGDNIVTLPGFSPGSYSIKLLSLFNGQPGYSDGTNHNATQPVTARPAISNFNANKFDVHCHEGEDGKIDVSAQGGTKTFISYLWQSGQVITSINLTESLGNSFTTLKAGTYTVTLKDSNGCDPKNASNQVVTYDLVISQPQESVFVSAIEAVEPLAFGYTDGYIKVRSQYGTTPYTFSWIDVNNNTPLTADPPVTVGESITSTLSSIGKGKYHVRAEDANYVLAFPAIDKNIRGCFDTLTIFLDEPPLLEVVLDEYHFVSCYAYTDGEIVAHAKGGRPYLSGPYLPYQYEWFQIDNNSSLVPFGQSDSIAVERPSAWYRIKVTDRNGISAWSDDFHLIQPDQLKISFNTSQLLCNGDTNGTSEALPQGGTLPYRYAWSTDEETSLIQNLTDGWYSVIVTDDRGCTTFGQTEVTVPNSLEVQTELKDPTCYQYSDGSIKLNVNGGKAPYKYLWEHGEETDFASGLAKGQYTVKVQDDNLCFIVRAYELNEPNLLPVDLGNDKVLCKDQVLQLNAAIDDPAAEYAWLKDGSLFATTSAAALSDAGTYTLKISDSKGCINQDDIKITRDETVIAADFVVATRVPKGERVRIANISNPAPDKMEWIIPSGTNVIEEKTEYLELIFSNYGEYIVGLRSFKGACDKTEYKTIRAVNRSELSDYQTPDEPYIKQFVVTPNPNGGNFTATVELKEAADFKLLFYSGQGNIVAEKTIKFQSFSNVNFETSSSVSNGIYMLQLITSQGVATFKVMINK